MTICRFSRGQLRIRHQLSIHNCFKSSSLQLLIHNILVKARTTCNILQLPLTSYSKIQVRLGSGLCHPYLINLATRTEYSLNKANMLTIVTIRRQSYIQLVWIIKVLTLVTLSRNSRKLQAKIQLQIGFIKVTRQVDISIPYKTKHHTNIDNKSCRCKIQPQAQFKATIRKRRQVQRVLLNLCKTKSSCLTT